VHKYLIEVVNFLPDDLVEQLVDFSKHPNLPWSVQEMQENLPRQKISWLIDSPIETTHDYFKSLPTFAQLNFMGITLWKDNVDFWMPAHIDNDRVKVAVQIYLDDRQSPGTQFPDRLIKYGRNRGYIMYNNPDMLHGVSKQTPHEGRLSIYALYD
jgi:hypothetical protein